jgi:hypothetical protein
VIVTITRFESRRRDPDTGCPNLFIVLKPVLASAQIRHSRCTKLLLNLKRCLGKHSLLLRCSPVRASRGGFCPQRTDPFRWIIQDVVAATHPTINTFVQRVEIRPVWGAT